MTTKTYGLHALMDMCGGDENSVREMFPRLDLEHDELWLCRSAKDALMHGQFDEAAPSNARLEAERLGWTWHPARDSGKPVLPVPFTACQLAAFMLAGEGMNLYEKFDFGAVVDWRTIPELPDGTADDEKQSRAQRIAYLQQVERDASAEFETALRSLGDNADEAREVLRDAIRLRRKADAENGRSDEGVRLSAKWLLDGGQGTCNADADTPATLDHSLLASPHELIAAFGVFTGMNPQWFKSLGDSPALKAARKRPGVSGRKGSPPLFCPMEVTRWLLDPTRKKGRPFKSEDTAWRLLEASFPKVHAKHSAADPRDK